MDDKENEDGQQDTPSVAFGEWKKIYDGFKDIEFDVIESTLSEKMKMLSKTDLQKVAQLANVPINSGDSKKTIISDLIKRVIGRKISYGSGPNRDSVEMSEGGIVPGHGDGDTVPAMLEPGELVIPKEKVSELAAKQSLLTAGAASVPGVPMSGSTSSANPTQVLGSVGKTQLDPSSASSEEWFPTDQSLSPSVQTQLGGNLGGRRETQFLGFGSWDKNTQLATDVPMADAPSGFAGVGSLANAPQGSVSHQQSVAVANAPSGLGMSGLGSPPRAAANIPESERIGDGPRTFMQQIGDLEEAIFSSLRGMSPATGSSGSLDGMLGVSGGGSDGLAGGGEGNQALLDAIRELTTAVKALTDKMGASTVESGQAEYPNVPGGTASPQQPPNFSSYSPISHASDQESWVQSVIARHMRG